MRRLGGIPIHRSASRNVLSLIVEAFNKNDKLLLAISPEGARKKVDKWKTGFWYIVKQAGVPVQRVSCDCDSRKTVYGPVIEPSGDIEADMKRIQNYYREVTAKNPGKFGGEYL